MLRARLSILHSRIKGKVNIAKLPGASGLLWASGGPPGGEGLSAKLTGGTASLGWIAACTVRRMTP